MLVAQLVPMLPVSASADLARLQRPVSHHGRIRGGRPFPPVGAAVELPAPQVSQTESAVAARVHAAGDLAGGRAQDRVARCGNQHIDSELGAHQRLQAAVQAGIGLRGQRRGTHRCTSLSVSQPAATSARRASSIFRWA